uniref:EGF-like domain-containing protein n=1 Tax=Helicotheca tamesis TaxID=374047 RepID=A0A7S2IEL5_9STRA|mmetsp:Transcript_8655/g.11979  ORF Transcript_8655/g.11979 Transcript_8655/m.11979 type:complete len:618 (+) Transcript_8655:59-1912(+)
MKLMNKFILSFGLGVFFLSTSPFSSIVTEAACIVEPGDFEKGCHFFLSAPSCPSGYKRVKYGDCGCRWGVCTKSYYRCEGVPRCCGGWTGGSACDVPICEDGCNAGECVLPGICECPEGYDGKSCEIAPPPSVDELTVMTLNFACRDTFPFSGCDNCQTRFDLLRKAILGDADFEGLPDLDLVDVILAQELGTEKENFEQISSALKDRGFQYTTGDPAPTADDSICSDPLVFDSDDKDAGSSISGLNSGGLVTWSKFPIVGTHAQNWCAHTFPLPAGYLSTLLDVGNGRAIAVINLHAMPEYDLQIEAEDVRAYQFGELSGFAGELSNLFHDSNTPFSVILGGDFNEDIYSRNSLSANPGCGSITSDLVEQKFGSVGLHIRDACTSNKIGNPTWDPTRNDLAGRFSESGTHQVLDFLIQHSSSHAGNGPENVVSVLKSKTPWSGQFCEGYLDVPSSGTASALSDHNVVTATFQLPQGTSTSNMDDALATYKNAINSWINGNLVDNAACGQEGSGCGTDSDCCSKEHSWTSSGQYCNNLYQCEPCRELHGSCGPQIEGSMCCGYNDYKSDRGTHCEIVGNLGAICIRKFVDGTSCLWDEECRSKRCIWKGLSRQCAPP